MDKITLTIINKKSWIRSGTKNNIISTKSFKNNG